MIDLTIRNENTIYTPAIVDGITWDTERKNAPGKLTFKVLKDSNLKFEEGNAVSFKYNDKNIFYGFVFKKQYSKDDTINITVYDQLRYFKYKKSYIYYNKKVSELLKMIAEDFNLNLGNVIDTEYIISKADEEGTIFDTIGNALELTKEQTNKLFCLYDSYGSLTLNNIENMTLNILIDEETCEDFDFTTDIDNNVYNQIEIAFDNKDTGTREIYIAKDSANINKWGVLQYYEKINTSTNAKNKADTLLKMYNQKNRNLTLENCLGHVDARAGFSPVVKLNLDDINIYNRMVIEKAKHTFKDGEHLMDLTLQGVGIYG